MLERTEILDGSKAYSVAMENLKSTWSVREGLKAEYPDRFFHYGEEGRGLILPQGLVYISTESAEDIRAVVDGKITIGSILGIKRY